jgi:hypothetical protein
MILPVYKQQSSQEEHLPVDSGSSDSPPPFQDDPPSGMLIDFSDGSEAIPGPGGEEPPPVFTPYEAECFNTGSGDIVSHDPHLNNDGGWCSTAREINGCSPFLKRGAIQVVGANESFSMYLYKSLRFLLSQSTRHPNFILQCRGTHIETRYRHVRKSLFNPIKKVVQTGITGYRTSVRRKDTIPKGKLHGNRCRF